MDTQQQKKPISVILRLNQFDELNGALQKFSNDAEREKFVENFFMQRFGHGAGRLQIAQKPSKVKLSWYPQKYDPEAERYHQEALTKANNRNFKEAINKWVKAISLNSGDPDFYFNLGIAFFELKNYKESIENLNISLKLCPVYYKSHLILGTVHLKVRQFEKSEEHLKQSIMFLPNHALAYLNLGAVYSILKRYNEGIRMFEKTIELSPREVRAHFGLGKIYSLKGDRDKANQYFKNVIEFDSNGKLTSHAQRAMVSSPLEGDVQQVSTEHVDSADTEKLYQDGYKAYLYSDFERAIQMYEAYLKRKQNDDFVWFALGASYLRAGQIDKAIESYQKAVSISSNKALYYKGLAIAYDFLDNPEEVIKQIGKTQQLGKNDDSVLYGLLGKAYLKQNKIPQAIESLENGLKKNENNLVAKYQLAVALMKNNDTDSAINHLQEIIRSPVNSPVKMEAEQLLTQLNT